MSYVDTVLECVWPAFDLPGIREHPQDFATYSGFSFNDLPHVPDVLEDDFVWLDKEPIRDEDAISFMEDPNSDLSVAEKVEMVIAITRYPLPRSFRYFITHPDLHRRIRSCTACYLELPNFLVETTQGEPGCLIHFLSDQQWCLHWYLYVNEHGEERVLCSPSDYGFYSASERDEAGLDALSASDVAVKVTGMELGICARSFSEFVYRFWLENELWWALSEGEELTPTLRRYADQYAPRVL